MTINTLPTPPSRSNPTNFAAAGDAFMAALPQFVTDCNTLAANLNSIAAGGAYAIPYSLNSSTTINDPTADYLNFNNSVQSSTTNIGLSLIAANGIEVTSILDTFGASSSPIKGTIRICKSTDPSKYLIFSVTGIAGTGGAIGGQAAAGWRSVAVTCIGSSSPSPFANQDPLMLFFQRTGDMGATGPAGSGGSIALLNSYVISGSPSLVSLLNIFTSSYDKYIIDIEGLTCSSAATLTVQLANAGVLDTSSQHYYNPAGSGNNLTSPGTTSQFQFGTIGNSSNIAATLTLEVRNANQSSTPKGFGVRGMANLSTIITEGAYSGGAVSGFQLGLTTGTFANGTIRVYGVKNS